MRDLQWRNYYDESSGILHANWIGGFFSNCTMALNALTVLAYEGINPKAIIMEKGWECACNRKTQINLDLYPYFFTSKSRDDEEVFTTVPHIDNHQRYANIKLKSYIPFVSRWFTPCEAVEKILNELMVSYQLKPSKTIAVVYRGTDKWTEVLIAPAGDYIKRTEQLLIKHPDHKILIQTDQKQVRDQFLKHFGDVCFFLPEMPVTETGIPIHALPENTLGMDKIKYSQILLAVMLLLSRCNFLVSHTGNMALWINLYRGNTRGTYQFDRHGICCDPRGRDMTGSLLKLFFRRAANILSKEIKNSLENCSNIK